MAIHYKSQYVEYVINPSNILYVQLFPEQKSINVFFANERSITLNFEELVGYADMVRLISDQM